MTVIFNLGVVGLVLLIAYWWANQGAFSAFLHLLAVIGAGIIALGLWEPLAFLLLRGGKFDNFAWGVTLIGLFSISLLLLRILSDKLCPANVKVTPWVNWSLGGALGAGAGVLTLGILIIGVGFVQSHREIMGFRHYGRTANGRVSVKPLMQMWLPVDMVTGRFFSFISRGSLYPTFNGTPLADYNPGLHRQAWLLRDSHNQGQTQISLHPREASVEALYYEENSGICAVDMVFHKGARDFSEQLILSASQVRLICTRRGSRPVKTIAPREWRDDEGRHLFDDASHYITSKPGQEDTTVRISFTLPSAETPRFIQVKNIRYRLPQEAQPLRAGGLAAGSSCSFQIDSSRGSIQLTVNVSNSIRPIRVSTNRLPGTMDYDKDRFLTRGTGTFPNRGGKVSRNLTVQGIVEAEGTRIVKVDVSRGSPADLFGKLRSTAGDQAAIYLTDLSGNCYTPIGYIYKKAEDTTILLHPSPANAIQFIQDLPPLPSTGDNKLYLLFECTIGVTINSLQVEPETVGVCTILVRPPKKK